MRGFVRHQLWEYSRCRTLEIVIVDTVQEKADHGTVDKFVF